MVTDILYDGIIVQKENIDNKKCYFAISDKEPYSLFPPDKISDRMDFLKTHPEGKKITSELGFTINWLTDITIFDVRKNLRGFENLRRYDMETPEYISMNSFCQAEAEIFGGESKILRNSKSKKDYLSKFVLQNRFEQQHGFEL